MTVPANASASSRARGPWRLAQPPVGGSIRQAALLLHALQESDRTWLMARLTQAERAAVETLLSELESLGIPADRGLVEEVNALAREVAAPSRAPKDAGRGADSPTASAVEDASAAKVAALARGDVGRLAAILREEPLGLVAHLIDLHAWPWSRALLRELGPAKSLRIQELRNGIPEGAGPTSCPVDGAGAALRERLLEAVCRRLEHAGGPQRAGPSGAPWWRVGWIRRSSRLSSVRRGLDRLLRRGGEA